MKSIFQRPKWRGLPVSARNVATLMGSTVAAQAVTFAATPLLTRLYSQDAYGVAGIYSAVVNTVSVIVTGKYELAIPLAEDDRSAAEILCLCLAVAFGVSAILIFPVALFPVEVARMLKNPALTHWLVLLPFSLFFLGMYQAFSLWCNRNGNFRPLAISRPLRSGLTVLTALGFARLIGGPGGLILAALVGQVAAALWMAGAILNKLPVLKTLCARCVLWHHARVHRDLPVFQASTSLVDNYAVAAPLLFMNWFVGTTATGALNLVVLTLGTPVNLVADSVGQVFFQNITEARRQGQSMKKLVAVHAWILLGLAVPGVCTMIVVGPFLFETLFGHGWRTSGEYARWLVMAYGFKFVVSPLRLFLPAAGKVRLAALWKVAYGITTTIALTVGGSFGAKSLLLASVVNDAVMYTIYFCMIWRAAQSHPSSLPASLVLRPS